VDVWINVSDIAQVHRSLEQLQKSPVAGPEWRKQFIYIHPKTVFFFLNIANSDCIRKRGFLNAYIFVATLNI